MKTGGMLSGKGKKQRVFAVKSFSLSLYLNYLKGTIFLRCPDLRFFAELNFADFQRELKFAVHGQIRKNRKISSSAKISSLKVPSISNISRSRKEISDPFLGVVG